MSTLNPSTYAPSDSARTLCTPRLFLSTPIGAQGSSASSQGSISPARTSSGSSGGRISPSYEQTTFKVGDAVVFEMTGSRIEGEVQRINDEECSVQILGTGRTINLPIRRLKPLIFGRITTQVE